MRNARRLSGYALAEGTLADAISARPVQVDPALTIADAFMTIGVECLRHVTCNEIAVRCSDPEGIHQMRAGLRRLRAASSLFKENPRHAPSTGLPGVRVNISRPILASKNFSEFGP